MTIWVDADSCPVVIKDILFRAAERAHIELTLVANHHVRVPGSKYIRSIQVQSGFDVADDEIVRRCEDGDLVITGDIPLAAEVIEKGCMVLNSRGEKLTANNIRAKLNMRDFMDTMRASGVESGGGPAALNQGDRQEFANQLDSWLAKNKKP